MKATFTRFGKKKFPQKTKLFIGILAIFMIAMGLGSICAFKMKKESLSELTRYLSDFFSIFKNNSVPFWELFKSDFYGNFKYIVILFFSGFCIIGPIIVFAMLFYKGFCVGLSAAMFLRLYGMKGLTGGVLAIVSQNVIFVPIIILLGVESVLLSVKLFGMGREKSISSPESKSHMMTFSVKCVLFSFFLIILSFVDTLILPLVMRLTVI